MVKVLFFPTTCLIFIAVTAGKWDIALDEKGNLGVKFNSVQILSHSTENPIVYIGAGTTTFDEHYGNFDIKDSIERRIPLDVASFPEANKLIFVAKSDSSLRITMNLGEAASFGIIEVSTLPAGYDRIWLRFVAVKGERIYGGGEQFTHLNLKGRRFPIWTREQGVGRNKSTQITFDADRADGGGGDYHTTYYGEPTYFSDRGYWLHSTATFYSVLDFTNDDFHELEVHGNVGSLKVGGGDGSNLSQLSQQYSQGAGLMPELPEWVYNGAIVGLQGGTSRMNELLSTIEGHGVKVSAVWIQDWAGKLNTAFGQRVFWNWEWDPQQYPGLDKEIPKLKARGVRVLTYINPYLNTQGPLFKEADKLGYFVRNDTDQTYIADFGGFLCGTIDLTYPDAVAWYKRRIVQRAIDLGISGWMADFSEYLMVYNAKFHSGQSAFELHNKWPLLWARLNREAVEEAGKLGEVVFWSRAGYAGVSKYTTMFWAGDQNVDYTESDGMPSTIPAALSIGLQGVGMTHYDIGCYTSLFNMKRDKQLFLRSAESAVFTSLMRTHEGNRPSENWQLYSDADTMKKFAQQVDVYTFMKDYIRDAVKEYTLTATPLQRPLFYAYPNDSRSWEVEYEYLFGPELLVAPVLQPNVTEWSCYLPPGQWTHLWTGKSYVGQADVTVPAPLGQPPVFYMSGSKYPWQNVPKPAAPVNPGGDKSEL